jgi:aryl-alcohol dehydrogenase-like predicted oxidoreductase
MQQLTIGARPDAPGLRVSSLCLGTGQYGSKIDRASAFRLLDHFVDHGGNFLDTANVYGDWVPGAKSSSEKVLGAWLHARRNRDQIMLATKGGHPLLQTMHIPRLSPAEIIYDLEQSLGHLQTDRIDLYWLHRDDPPRPVGEILETLAAQVQMGKIRAFGCSNWRVERIRAAQRYAAQHGLPGFVGDQMLWSLAAIDPAALPDRTTVAMEPALYAYHRESGLAAIPYSAQANGLFHKLAERRAGFQPPAHYPLAANQARRSRAQLLADELKTSLTGIVLGYLQSQPFATVPIVGPQTPAQLQDTLAGDGVRLTQEQLSYLESDP